MNRILCRLIGHKMVWAFAYPNVSGTCQRCGYHYFEKRTLFSDTTDTRRKEA